MDSLDNDHYRPSVDINGDYRTRRVYGAMATFDDQTKIITGLQLLQPGVLDVETLQENIDGLDNIPLINQRNDARQAQETLFERLRMRAEQDPLADAALVEIMDKPEDKAEILKKYFTPQEPEMSPEEEAFAQPPMMPGAEGMPPGMPPPISTAMSRIEGGGAAEAGVQTVGRL
jgi:hypothetical protein